jgi:sterol desaturase/sphingolipid hydroxylase (fatty acid hydroxylase superfamily)
MSFIPQTPAPTLALILLVMAALALLELAIPLHPRDRSHRAHLGPNLALTAITFVTNAVFNVALILALLWAQAKGWGLLNVGDWGATMSIIAVVIALDLAYYLLHVAMHKVPALWRFHRVHHADPAVDVTTTVRQHPGEGLLRYGVMFLVAVPLGASPAAFAVYRVASAVNGALEHANIRAPQWLDTALSWITTWPHAHKIHHSRDSAMTDTNYGNLFSCWDRLFSTFTPSRRGTDIAYGLDDLDDPAQQTTAGLLALPFADTRPLAIRVTGPR